MRAVLFAGIIVGVLAGCAALDGVLDYPMSVFDDDSGEVVETTVGDALADNAEKAEGVVSGLLGGINPLAGVAGGAAAAALFGAARRKKKKAAVVSETPGGDEPA